MLGYRVFAREHTTRTARVAKSVTGWARNEVRLCRNLMHDTMTCISGHEHVMSIDCGI